jgi:hypothetical protein
VLILLAASFLIRLVSLFIAYTQLFKFNTKVATVDVYVNAFFRIVPISLWMACSLLILGFWFDVLKSKLKPQIGRRTRIVCIVGASLLLLQIPGFFLLGFNVLWLGALLTFLPYIVDIIGMIVLTIVISCKSDKQFSAKNAKRKKSAVRKLIVICALWIGYFVMLIAVSSFTDTPGGYLATVIGSISMEFLICLFLMLLVDRTAGPKKLFEYVILSKEYLSDNARTKKDSMSESTSSETPRDAKSNTLRSSAMTPSIVAGSVKESSSEEPQIVSIHAKTAVESSQEESKSNSNSKSEAMSSIISSEEKSHSSNSDSTA